MTEGPFVVAIDGPSGAGKTAAGTLLAQRLDATLVDTGIFYRGLTLLALRHRIDVADEDALLSLIPDLGTSVRVTDTGPAAEVLYRSRPLGDEIFSGVVDAMVSAVARHPAVRDALLALQRAPAEGRRAVVTGRDIGTVVFPDAEVKIFLDASPAERARRRTLQVGEDPGNASIEGAMIQRDAADSARPVAPLARATDAVVIDTDLLSLEAVVDSLERIVRQRVGGRS